MSKLFKNGNSAYIFWFLFYFTLFWLIFGASIISFLVVLGLYTVSILLAFSSIAESLCRKAWKARSLHLMREQERLLPLFKEVYIQACNVDAKLSRVIKLFVEESMSINAYAFGRETMILTRGSIELLSDDNIKAIMAHEFGHFSNGDTIINMLTMVGNFYYTIFLVVITKLKNFLDGQTRGGFLEPLRWIYLIIYWFFRGIFGLSNLILLHVSRKQEYIADYFAVRCGYGKEMAELLNVIYSVSFGDSKNILEQIRSTHPPTTKRIERIERVVY